MTRMRWLGLSCLLLAGCVSLGTSELASDQTMAQIRVGETTKQQVTSLLGEPERRRTTEMGGATREWWAYRYESAVINPLDYLFLYGFFFNGIGFYDTRYDLSLFFDHRGVVSSVSRLRTDYDMGRPFTSKQVSSVAHTMIAYPEATKQPLQFEDRVEYRY